MNYCPWNGLSNFQQPNLEPAHLPRIDFQLSAIITLWYQCQLHHTVFVLFVDNYPSNASHPLFWATIGSFPISPSRQSFVHLNPTIGITFLSKPVFSSLSSARSTPRHSLQQLLIVLHISLLVSRISDMNYLHDISWSQVPLFNSFFGNYNQLCDLQTLPMTSLFLRSETNLLSQRS